MITTMKKIFLLFAAVVMAAGVASAQDLNKAIEAANHGNEAFQVGEYGTAIESFQNSLKIAEALGEEGAEHANTCKVALCNIHLAHAKSLIKASDFDAALNKLNETISVAEGYENAETATDAKALIPQVYMQKGNTAYKAKDMANAISSYAKVTEIDPTNGNAYLLLGRAYAAVGQGDNAVAAYEAAAANGEEKDAKKQLSTYFTKLAQASRKAQKWQEALGYAEKSLSYLETANALNFAGEASAKLGKNVQAIEFFEKYLAIAPNAKNINNIKYQIAGAAEAAGNKAKAIEFYKMISTDPALGEYAKHKVAELSK